MTTLEDIAQRLASLEQRVAETERERDDYRALYLASLERCRKLELGLLSSKSERLPDNDAQLSLGVISLVLNERQQAALDEALAAASAEQTIPEHTRRKPTGRKPLPEHLPRVEIEVLPPEVQKKGLDAFERIGEEISEVVERRPASIVIARVVRPKFVVKDRDREMLTKVHVAEPLELPIPRGLAGPGMLADTIVRRWQDHMPLNRLEGMYARDGVELARSTVCGWHSALGELVAPLVAAMRDDAFKQPYLCTDATGVLVQQKERCRTGHFWVLVAPGRHVLFEYTRDHSGDAVDDVLSGYQGYLVADAHVVYDHLYATGDVVEVNCWAHARRYFFKALDSDPDRAKVALGFIGALFRIERTIADSPRKKKEKIREKRSRHIVDAFFSWCDAEAEKVLDDTPISRGIRYARNQRPRAPPLGEDEHAARREGRARRERLPQAHARRTLTARSVTPSRRANTRRAPTWFVERIRLAVTVEQADVIDAIGVERETGKLVLTIMDHLDWSEPAEHLVVLQAKINAFATFMETGQMVEDYPDAAGRDVILQVFAKYGPPKDPHVHGFYQAASDALAGLGVGFRVRLVPDA